MTQALNDSAAEPLNPVVGVLTQRARDGRRPGGHDDGCRVALAVEGGGMRGIVSAAMMVALRDRGLVDAFDDVYALSAGAINSAYLLAGGEDLALALYHDDLVTQDFLDYRRVLTRSPVLSLDYVIDRAMEVLKPFDYDSALQSPARLHLVTSSVNRVQPRVLSDFASKDSLKTALRASCCLPWIAGPPVAYEDDLLLDGGVLMPHPLVAALADGCTHIVVIRTRQWGTSPPRPSLEGRLVALYLERIRKGLGSAFIAGIREYGEVRDLSVSTSARRSGPPFILDVACPPGAHEVTRFSRDKGVLYEGMRAGYRAMLTALTGQDRQVFLRPATLPGQGD